MSLSRFPHGISSFGVPVTGDSFVPFMGDTYYVKKTADSDYTTFRDMYNYVTSKGQYSVCTTADEAFERAGRHDRIIFMPPDSGAHDLTQTITIGSSQYGLKVFGAGNTMYNQRTTIKNPTTAADTEMFIIKTDKVEIAGLCFQNRQAGACIQIGDTAGQAYYQIYIHDCNFTDYGSVATYGITPGALAGADTDQADTVNLVVENCYFDGFVTAAIKSNGTRDAYVGNYIKVPNGGIGIHLFKHTDSRGGGLYKNNYMIGAGNSMGITVTDVGSAVGANNIVDNYFVNFGTNLTQPITKQTYLQGGGNYYAAADGTWTGVDIVT